MPRPRRARKAVNYVEEPVIISTDKDSDDEFVVDKKTRRDNSDDEFVVDKKRRGDNSSCYSSQDDLPLKSLVKKVSQKATKKAKDDEIETNETSKGIKINSTSSFVNLCRPNLSDGEESSESDDDDEESSKVKQFSEKSKVVSQPLASVDLNNNKMDVQESSGDEEERLSQSPPTSPPRREFTQLVENQKSGDKDILNEDHLNKENVVSDTENTVEPMEVELEPLLGGKGDKKLSLSTRLSAKQKRALSTKEEENNAVSSGNEDLEVTKVVPVRKPKRRKKEVEVDKENNESGNLNISIKQEPTESEGVSRNRKSLRLRKSKIPEEEVKPKEPVKIKTEPDDSSDEEVSLLNLKEGRKGEKETLSHNLSLKDQNVSESADTSSEESDSDNNWEEVDEVKAKPKSKAKGKAKKSVKEEEAMAADKEGSVGAIQDLEVSVKVKSIHAKRNKCGRNRQQKLHMWARQMFHRMQKYAQVQLHKTHVLCLFARAIRQNSFCNNKIVAGLCLSLVPSMYFEKAVVRWDVNFMWTFLQWFQKDALELADLANKLKLERIHVFVVILRALGFNCRAVFSLQPVLGKLKKADLQALDEKKSMMTPEVKKEPSQSAVKSESKKRAGSSAKSEKKSKPSATKRRSLKMETPDDDAKTTDTPAEESKTPMRKSNRAKKKQDYVDSSYNDDSDPDFNEKGKKIKTPAKNASAGKPSKRKSVPAKPPISSSTEDDESTYDTWTEVYMATQKQWICIEIGTDTVNVPGNCEANAKQPLQYVIGIDNNEKVKDITCRYAKNWLTMNRKLRVDREWWAHTLEPYEPPDDVINISEDGQLNSELMRQEMPTSIAAFKDHPLYVLQRHLLKFQAIYPEGTVPVGYIGKNAKKEAVYPRDCVHTLKTHQSWIKEGRSIIPGEQAYKIVKGKKKWRDRHLDIPDPMQSCFGEWQTEKYIPPPVVNGKITKNEYGNVELFKPWMLPEGAVHIPLEKAVLIARKLDIDYAQAMMGWDYHGGYMHPVFEGIVVAKEHEDKVYEAWNRAEEERELKALKKQEERIYTNWKKLIKGLMIRAKLSAKYTVDEEEKPKPKGKSNAKPKAACGGKRKSVKNEDVEDEGKEEEVKEEAEKIDHVARTEASAYWPINKQVGVFDPTTA